jgi:uncharacterized GH25 family protein
MTCLLRRCAALVVVASALVPVPAPAHEHWLVPGRWRCSSGEPTTLGARVGEGLCGPARPFQAERTVRFELHAARAVDLRAAAAEGDTVWARVAPADGGGLLVAYESNFVTHRMEASAFDAYLEADGHDSVLAVRRAAHDTTAGRERYRRCSKLWVPGTGSDRSRPARVLGMPLELVPLSEPGAGPSLVVRVLSNGRPLAGALVQAWRGAPGEGGASRGCAEERAAPAVWKGRTDRDGLVRVTCDAPGEWVIGCVNMVRSTDPATADWESTWASLAFARAATASGAR